MPAAHPAVHPAADPAANLRPGVDLFCRVVDNYGDIGVCWRLACGLAREHGGPVRLWVDAIDVAARVIPGLDAALATQMLHGVTVCHWHEPLPDVTPHPVVIEAFACNLPEAWVAQLTPSHRWLNLEYLSAEDWIEDCHGLPSPQPGGQNKHFFFPGFTERTGGLLREAGLLDARDAFQAQGRDAYLRWLGAHGLDAVALAQAARAPTAIYTLFCYPHAPLAGWLTALAAQDTATLVLVPGNTPLPLAPGQHGSLTLARLPFLSQDDYDRLLWGADLNLVRGEDSCIRAHWAGRPMVWHIYPQDQDDHLHKLDAWLARAHLPATASALQLAWNQPDADIAAAWRATQGPDAWSDWQSAARQFSQALGAQTTLVERLAKQIGQPG